MMKTLWRGNRIPFWGLVFLITMTLACGSESQQSDEVGSGRGAVSPTSVQAADLSTPEGPLYVIMKAAREKDLQLYRSAFAESVPPELISKRRFAVLVQRVRQGAIEPVPGVEKISETEAIVKLKNKRRNRERALRVRKIGDQWRIVGIVR